LVHFRRLEAVDVQTQQDQCAGDGHQHADHLGEMLEEHEVVIAHRGSGAGRGPINAKGRIISASPSPLKAQASNWSGRSALLTPPPGCGLIIGMLPASRSSPLE